MKKTCQNKKKKQKQKQKNNKKKTKKKTQTTPPKTNKQTNKKKERNNNNNNNNNKSKKAYQLMKKLTSSKQGRNTTIQDKAGECLAEEQDILKRWTEYCSELYIYTQQQEIPRCQMSLHQPTMTATLSCGKKLKPQ